MILRKTLPHSLRLPALAGLAVILGMTPAARAIVIEFGDIKGNFDTTISVGGLYRLGDPDPQYYGITSKFGTTPGLQRSVNNDDGNLNYRSGTASFLVKASHDLLLKYKDDAGVFVRGFYFNDFVNTNGSRGHAPLSDEALSIVGENAELLDAYVYFKPTLGTMPSSLRIGRQVLSWGESTFIPNGINSINPIDVAKLRTPGSELKEALRPVNMVSASLTLTENLSLEAFYLLDWERTRIDPPGTYFSNNDYAAKGGTKVMLGFGAIPDSGSPGGVPRGRDNEPGSSGQYGVNLRFLAHGLNDTEFGLFFMNYHSRLPVISAQTPTDAISSAVVAGQLTTLLVEKAGVPPAAAPATAIFLLTTAATNPGALSPTQLALVNGAKTLGFLQAAGTGRYLIEFPEDIQLVGGSFNTSLHGIALQGEMSYRKSQPLQVDDVELLFAAFSSINPAFGPNNQIGNLGGKLNTYVPGYRRLAVWTGQMTATWVGKGFLGAEQTTLLAEAGFVNADLPSKGTLRFDGPGTFVGGDINYMNNSGSNTAASPAPLSEPASAFADSFSWGFQLVGRLEYNNVFKGVNVAPVVIYSQDVIGNTPLPMGNFLHGRKSFTLGAEFTFQNAWALDLRYVNFFGAGRYNLISDRDYVSCNLKYSF